MNHLLSCYFFPSCLRQLRNKPFSFIAVHEAGLQGIYLGSLMAGFIVLLSEPMATSLCWKGDEMCREHCKPHLLAWSCSDTLFTVVVFVLRQLFAVEYTAGSREGEWYCPTTRGIWGDLQREKMRLCNRVERREESLSCLGKELFEKEVWMSLQVAVSQQFLPRNFLFQLPAFALKQQSRTCWVQWHCISLQKMAVIPVMGEGRFIDWF